MALSERQKHHIEAWQDSGLTKSAYCRQSGLNVKTFARWCRLARQAADSGAPALIPVRLQPEPTISGTLSLRWPQGHVLEIPGSVSPHWLGELLQCLA